MARDDRCYWVVSPNVMDDEHTVGDWRNASVSGHAAFMGYRPNARGHGGSGYRFAHVVKPGDLILIARRHDLKPEIVGFGVVQGKFQKSLKGIDLPERPGSLRRLSPFLSRSTVPSDKPLFAALRGITKALTQLKPTSNPAHKKLCGWLESELKRDASWRDEPKNSSGTSSDERNTGATTDVRIGELPRGIGEDYKVRTQQQVRTARKTEAVLVERYRQWLRRNYPTSSLSTVSYGKLRCDLYEQDRCNLIEAKASVAREDMRMAVGQLLDYAYLGREKFGEAHKAILVPEEPSTKLREWFAWLKSLEIEIDLVWPCGKDFIDTAKGQFT